MTRAARLHVITAPHVYLSRRVGAEKADDLASTTFAVAFERRGKFHAGAGNARPWRFGIATNLLRKEWRARVAVAVSREKTKLAGMSVKRAYLRAYPYGSLAAQVFGTVGPISAVEMHAERYQGVPQSAIVGQSGLEYSYDSYLRAGDSLRTSLNLDLEKVGDAALARAIAQNPPATGGAFVAMNPEKGRCTRWDQHRHSTPRSSPGHSPRPHTAR
ncbi:MAG: hypothetical protein ACLP01_32790 [Solirubrobacteraceae bacterium]